MRSVLVVCAGFVLAALIWAVYTPLSRHALVHSLADPRFDPNETAAQLISAGRSAHAALLSGLDSSSPQVRLHCARILSLGGDRRGDAALMTLLRQHGREESTLAAQAETYLLNAWVQRDGPPAPVRHKLLRDDAFKTDADRLLALNDTLVRYPGWASGYIQRAIVYQRTGSIVEARLDLLRALDLEPLQFEAMLVLGSCSLLLNASDQAYASYEQAVRLNPRLRVQYRNEIREVLKAIEIERARRRREKRREMPVA